MALATQQVPTRRPLTAVPPQPLRQSRPTVHALVVHHADVVRAGVSALLASGSMVETSHAASVFEAFRLAAAFHPNLILFDFTAAEGAEATRLFAGLWPRPRLVALVGRANVDPEQCLRAGADAAVAVDNVSRENFLSVVQRVIDGRAPVVAGFPAQAARRRDLVVDEGPTAILTPREREMLFLIGEGLSNREIAESLVLSVKTVEAHRANLSRKLNVRSRAGLMRLAMSARFAGEQIVAPDLAPA